jgi:hypothetical protein
VKNILHKINVPFLLFLTLCNIFLICVTIPLIMQYTHSAGGTYYPWVHNYHGDYYLYLSAIRESKGGEWLLPAMFTSEQTKSSFLYIFFIGVGKLAWLFRLSPVAAYHVARVLSMELLFIASYLLVRLFYSGRMVFISLIIGWFTVMSPKYLIGLFSPLFPLKWNEMVSPLLRFDYPPHHVFGLFILTSALYSTIKFLKKRTGIRFLTALILGFATAVLYPSTGLIFVLGLPLSIVLNRLTEITHKKNSKHTFFIPLAIITLAAILGLLIVKAETNKGFPWSQWKDWDVGMWNKVPNFGRDFMISSGIPFFLSAISVVYLLQNNQSTSWMLLVAWTFLPYLLLPFATILGIGKARMITTGNFIPMGILSAYLLKKIADSSHKKKLGRIGVGSIIVILCISSGIQSAKDLYTTTQSLQYGYSNYHIPIQYIESMTYLDMHIPKHSVVLADEYIGSMLPAFASLKSYYGHITQTKDFTAKQQPIQRFYIGMLSPDEARSFLKEGRIGYVWVGEYERNVYQGTHLEKYMGFLKSVYRNKDVEVYQVI